jgi:hypothetical protein
MSRLYPGFGSGKGTYTNDFTVQSLISAGHGEMEAGDKIILPQSALKDITRLKLPFPLTFRVTSDKCVGRGVLSYELWRGDGCPLLAWRRGGVAAVAALPPASAPRPRPLAAAAQLSHAAPPAAPPPPPFPLPQGRPRARAAPAR